MQLENIDKEEEKNIPEDSHVLHFWQPCKFEIDENLKIISEDIKKMLTNDFAL